jgi:phosphate/sulfate permease
MLNYISFFGPTILFFATIILLKNKNTLLNFYLFGLFSSSIVNYMLKGLIKDPRPNEDVHVFNMELNSPSRRVGFDRFGLPSSSTQAVVFSLVYIYLALKNRKIAAFYAAVSIITIYQKMANNNNSFIQIFFGALVGGLIAYIFYEYAKHILKKELKEKLEDDAPI